MIYWNLKNWIHISIKNPFKTMNKLKGVFVPLDRMFQCGTKVYYPFIYCPKPAKILIRCCDVEWKDKWNSPRYEEPPYVWIHLFGFNLIWWWARKEHAFEDDDYWEQALWYLYYASYNKEKRGYDELDISKARKKWPWKKYDKENECWKNSWNDNFLI